MCAEIWTLWGIACYAMIGLCLGFGWVAGQKLAGMVIK